MLGLPDSCTHDAGSRGHVECCVEELSSDAEEAIFRMHMSWIQFVFQRFGGFSCSTGGMKHGEMDFTVRIYRMATYPDFPLIYYALEQELSRLILLVAILSYCVF